jgi:hypothetical protein
MVYSQNDDDRDAAIGVAMTGVGNGPFAGTLPLALESLDVASRNFGAFEINWPGPMVADGGEKGVDVRQLRQEVDIAQLRLSPTARCDPRP